MLKAIVFDFDGVILDSANIKTDVFSELFAEYPARLDEIIQYHISNAGVSRFRKFQHVYEKILKLPYSDALRAELGHKFSDIALTRVLSAPFIDGIIEFLESSRNKYKLFVATGTPINEMLHIVERRGLNKYFEKVYGSPQTKDEILADIMGAYGIGADELLFFGDAMTDYNAAKESGVCFVGVGGGDVFPEGTRCILNFTDEGHSLLSGTNHSESGR